MNQNSLLRRLLVIALLFALGSLFMAPGSTHAQENDDGAVDLDNLKLILEVDSIKTYRGHMSMNFSGEAFEMPGTTGGDTVNLTIDSEVTKNPFALRMMMSIDQTSLRDDVEFVIVDGVTYVNINGEWEKTDEPLLDPDELLAQANQAEQFYSAEIFQRVGPETVNGRQTVHYRADKANLVEATTNDPQAEMFFAGIEEAQFDIWVDQSENFGVKEQVVMAGKGFNEDMPEASGRIEIMVEFYDFNAPITITAPSISEPEPPTISPEPEPEPPTISPEPEPEPPTTSPEPEPEPPTTSSEPEPEPEPPTSPEPDSTFEPEALPTAKSILEKAQE